MFAFLSRLDGVAFTDAVGPGGSVLSLPGRPASASPGWIAVQAEIGLPIAVVKQVHSAVVLPVDAGTDLETLAATQADALVTTIRGLALAVRVADCVPVLLTDAVAGMAGAAHAGRVGLAAGVIEATVAAMRGLGAAKITAWIGPHICGDCYEVPEAMRAEVAARLPQTWATTSWGTPALDLGRGAQAILEGFGCQVHQVGSCTNTTPTLHSYRRDAHDSGRQAGIVWLPAPIETP